MRTWGSQLAIALIKNGASVQDIEDNLSMPLVHIGLTVALVTGKCKR